MSNLSPPSTQTHERSMAGLEGILAHLRKRWFLLGVVAVIILAKIHPFVGAKGGEGGGGEGVGPLVHFIHLTCKQYNPDQASLTGSTSCCRNYGVFVAS